MTRIALAGCVLIAVLWGGFFMGARAAADEMWPDFDDD